MKRHSWILVAMVSLCGGCVGMNQASAPPRSQLEIRGMQTREYETQDTRMVMKAVLNVLQDDGFIVKNADMDLGLLTASKEVDIENARDAGSARTLGFLSGCGSAGCIYLAPFKAIEGAKDASFVKNALVEASANVSAFGESTRVRVNFQRKIMDNKGGVKSVEQIEDLAFYQEFFAKVDKGIFLQKQKL